MFLPVRAERRPWERGCLRQTIRQLCIFIVPIISYFLTVTFKFIVCIYCIYSRCIVLSRKMHIQLAYNQKAEFLLQHCGMRSNMQMTTPHFLLLIRSYTSTFKRSVKDENLKKNSYRIVKLKRRETWLQGAFNFFWMGINTQSTVPDDGEAVRVLIGKPRLLEPV